MWREWIVGSFGKRKRYRYYKRGPENEEENEELLQVGLAGIC